jgi:hypothetical protein
MKNDEAVLLIPAEPDVGAQQVVEESTCDSDSERSSTVTCQVEIQAGDADFSCWTLYSRDQNGERKTSGGDEFYIRYEEFTDDQDNENNDDGEHNHLVLKAVAIITDHKNGSYSLDFVTPPMNPNLPFKTDDDSRGILTVHFEYSDGIGQLPPPCKHDWKNGGYTHNTYTYTYAGCPVRPPIRHFRPPSHSESGIIDLGSYDEVLCFGDSTMDQFVRQRYNKKGKYYFQPNVKVGEKVLFGLNHQNVDSMLEMLDENFGEELRNREEDKDDHVAMILGSCLWDILDAHDALQGRDYEDHIQACRKYIECIRECYPNVTLFWKSPMAVHIHWVDLERLVEQGRANGNLFGIDRICYMSASRSRFLCDIQAKVMRELNVPLLDLYEATYLSSDQLYPSDGRHYRPDLNRLMLSWFYDVSIGAKYFTNVPGTSKSEDNERDASGASS